MPRYGHLYHHIILYILLILYSSLCQSAFNHEIIGQREPGEATSSLIQASGLIANNNHTITKHELITTHLNQDGNNQSTGVTMNSDQSTHNGGNITIQLRQSDNSSSSDGGEAVMKGVIIANTIILVIGLCGNLVVILVILKFTRSETVTDIYIVNLAFADLMFILGLIFLITTMLKDHWIFGSMMCKLYMATTSLNQFASSLLLMVMSYDRYLAVCRPLKAQRVRHIKGAKIKCLGIWISCWILMTPIIYFARLSDDLTCAIFWPEWKSFNFETAFTLYSFALGFSVPLLLIAAFYFCVIRKLRLSASGSINTASSRRSRSRETTNRRIEHLVVGIICTYTICWLPYWITQLCVSFNSDGISPMTGFYECFLIATSLSYTNSALNPILYAFLSDNFKRRCSDVLSSIYRFRWHEPDPRENSHAHPTSTAYPENQSEASRLESKQLVVLNESVRLIPSSIQFNTEIKDLDDGEDLGRNMLNINNSGVNMTSFSAYNNKILPEGPKPATKKGSVAFSMDTIVVQAIASRDITKNHLNTQDCPDL